MANEFKPSVGKKISKELVDEAIEKFNKKYRKNKKVDTKSVFFGRNVLLRLLSEEGSSGITFFLTVQKNPAVGDKETIQLALVATKEDGSLLWDAVQTSVKSKSKSKSPLADPGSYDGGAVCPPYCPK